MAMRDKTRRRIARTVLILFGWGPLLLLVLIAFFIHGNTYDRWVESQLTSALEMQVNFSQFEHPRWDTSRYEDVVLSDPELGTPVLSCHRLEVEYQHTDSPIPLLRIRLNDCKVTLENSQSLWNFIERSFAHRRLWKNMTVEISMRNLTFDQSSQSIRYMLGSLTETKDGSVGVFSLYMQQTDSSGKIIAAEKPAQLQIARLKSSSPATTSIILDSTQCPISTELLSYWSPSLKRLGNTALYKGTVNICSSCSGWDGTLSGLFSNVSTNQIFVQGDKSFCCATGQIYIKHAQFKDERLTCALGRFDALNGAIDRTILDAAVVQLKLAGGGAFNPYYDMVPFRQLSLGFDYENEMVTFSGLCANCPKGTVLNGALPLLREPLSPSCKTPASTVVKMLNSYQQNSYIQIAKPAASKTIVQTATANNTAIR